MKKDKKKIIKFKCSECGKIYYRVYKPYIEEKWLYCNSCQECTLIEVQEKLNSLNLKEK